MKLSLKNKNKLSQAVKNKELVVFDLDGTLAESKSNLKADMSRALTDLLEKKKVAVIGGGRYGQFQDQLIANLKCPPALRKNLFIFPTTSMAFYRFRNGKWQKVYAKYLSEAEKKMIMNAFDAVFTKMHYVDPRKIWGEIIEDRGTQVSFSALGQKAPVKEKQKWYDRYDKSVRAKMARMLQKHLPKFEVRRGGLTTIDITRKGIDKAYGVRQIESHLHVPIKKMLFVGDAIFPGGNDYAALKTGIDYVKISGPEETKKIIRAIVG